MKNTTISILLKGIVDTNNELEKITNKKDKYLNELQNLEIKLSNEELRAVCSGEEKNISSER